MRLWGKGVRVGGRRNEREGRSGAGGSREGWREGRGWEREEEREGTAIAAGVEAEDGVQGRVLDTGGWADETRKRGCDRQ